MDFSDVLASSVHDIKNSLGLVLTTLDELLSDPQTCIGNRDKANVLQLETQRANSNLIQLLSLYKLEKRQLVPDLREHDADEFLNELLAENGALMDSLGIGLDYRCEEDTVGYFDETLVRGVVNSVIGNAQRYTEKRILVSAAREEDWLVLRVEDDGAGFPAHMLAAQQSTEHEALGNRNHTQLGLYFAKAVAELHRHGGRTGRVALRNAHQLQGGCFEMWLP